MVLESRRLNLSLLFFTVAAEAPFTGSIRLHTSKNPRKDPPLALQSTLLRLHLPLNSEVKSTSRDYGTDAAAKIRGFHRTIQSVGATGGVYKGQGRNRRGLLNRIY